MIKDGRNGSMPLGTSFLRKMRELPVIIRENISMHNICFQVNIEKPPLCYIYCNKIGAGRKDLFGNLARGERHNIPMDGNDVKRYQRILGERSMALHPFLI